MTLPAPGVFYDGRIRHRRFVDGARTFSYGLYLTFLDLDRVEEALSRTFLASARRPAPFRYRRRDYFGPPDLGLAEWIRRLVAERAGRRPGGEVFLLTHLRTLGVSFNPVSFYYVYDAPVAEGGSLQAIVAEITNTPWDERHAYVLDVRRAERRGDALRWGLEKEFHVSPFLPMEQRYAWTFTPPGERLLVHMENYPASEGHPEEAEAKGQDGDGKVFDATLDLRRGPALTTGAMLRRQLRHPALPALVLLRIYRQAARLWLRGTRFYDHPGGLRGAQTEATASGSDPSAKHGSEAAPEPAPGSAFDRAAAPRAQRTTSPGPLIQEIAP